jgi:glucose/arabinose dehydrogenase
MTVRGRDVPVKRRVAAAALLTFAVLLPGPGGVEAATGRTAGGAVAPTATRLAEANGESASASPASAPVSADFDPSHIWISLPLSAGGFTNPVLVTNAGDSSGRLFVVEQGGRIRIIKNGSVLATPFLDIHNGISTGGEQGLLGLAFHPNYKTNHKLYVNFTNRNGDTAISEYRVTTNPDRVSTATGRRIITIDQPYSNHNGGNLAFGPDGYLYIGMGDGGSAGDPGNRAQNVNSLLGKILRINVNGTSGSRQYRIPSSNPYVGRTGRDEIWARGLRNPWRWSFDRATGNLWIGDVGQARYEEIDRSTKGTRGAGWGVNYGWHVMEGQRCYIPSSGCSTSGKTLPLLEYTHDYGCSVTGGFVYRGNAYPMLRGGYFFADYCSGRIWTVSAGARSPATRTFLLHANMNISSFGESQSGELYLVDHAGGGVYRVVGHTR